MTQSPGTPPGQRQVVVLREGPPKGRGVWVDGIVGVLGVALLVYAGILGQTLPEPDIIPLQYLPEFNTTTEEATITYEGAQYGSILFTPNGVGITREDADTYVFEFEVIRDNVYQVRIQALTGGDDVPGSLADVWRFTLFNAAGDPQEGVLPKTLQTKMALVRPAEQVVDPGNLTTRSTTIPVPSELNEAWRWTAAPQPEFIDGNELTLDEARLLASERYTIPTKGTWRVEMKMSNAGDCPSGPPPSDQDGLTLYTACQQATANGDDPTARGVDFGNPLIVRGISYDYYDIRVMEA